MVWGTVGRRGLAAAAAVAALAGPALAEAPPLSIAVVEWKVRKGMEPDFLDYWATKTVIADRSGLVGEFLSREGDAAARFPWIRWTDRSTPEYTVFYNVGLWRSSSDFAEQVGRYVDVGRPTLPFEYDHRRRILVDPVEWRRGPATLPETDAPGVK